MQTREKVGIVWFGMAWHGMESVLSQMTYFFRQYIDKYGSLLKSFFSIKQRKISVYLLLLFFFVVQSHLFVCVLHFSSVFFSICIFVFVIFAMVLAFFQIIRRIIFTLYRTDVTK